MGLVGMCSYGGRMMRGRVADTWVMSIGMK